MSTTNIQHYDAIIAGARCAGVATALLLARQGARVLVLDKSRYGTDTLSTHALMRGAVLQLHRWGLLPAVTGAGTPPVRSTTFHLADAVTTIPVKPRHGVEALYAPRRSVLDAILADAARGAGADVRFGATVTGLRRDRAGRVTGITGRAGSVPLEASADLVVGADGRRSGDRNPLHYDLTAAKASRFGEIVVQGGITSAILNAVVAERLPGPGTVFLNVNWDFKAPVRPGDVITGRVEVIEARTDKPVTKLRTTVTRGDGTVALDGTAVCYTMALTAERPAVIRGPSRAGA
jgi:acyl dehydratase